MTDLTYIAASGGWIVAGVFLVAIVGVAVGIFSRSGSGIDQHPLGGERGDAAPNSEGTGDVTGQDRDEPAAFDEHGTR